MSLDITLLRLLKHRDKYQRLFKAVPLKAIDQSVAVILKDFGSYFNEFEADTIKAAPFTTWFLGFKHKGLKDEAATLYTELFKKLDAEEPEHIEKGIMARLVAAGKAQETLELIQQFDAGEDVDFYAALRNIVEDFEQALDRKVKNPQVMTSIEDLLKDEENDTGFHFRLAPLLRHIKAARGGTFMIWAARPDVGKTSFAADQLTHMAAQVDAIYPGEDRSILWFNNEGPGGEIVKRTFQAALGITSEEMVKLNNTPCDCPDPEGKIRTMLRQKYIEAMGGRAGVLRIFDVHDYWNHEIEDIMRLHKPAIIVFDMIDNIKFGGLATNNGQRTDQLLEAMYQWARMMCVKYDCVGVAMSQISADGDGLQWPTLPMLKDSKTGKQGAADVILTLGMVNDPMMAQYRYIGATKNKRVRTGMPKSPMASVHFDADRCRYKELPT